MVRNAVRVNVVGSQAARLAGESAGVLYTRAGPETVSYTHLTLPTICSV